MAEGESLPAGMLFTAVYVSPEWVAFSVNFFSPPLSLSVCFVTVVIVVVVVVYEEGKRWSVKPTNSPSSLAAGQGQRERKKEKFCVRFFFFFFLVLVLLLLSLLISLLLKAPGFYVIIQPFLSNFLCGVTSDKKMRLFLLFLFHFIYFLFPLFSSLLFSLL